MAELTSQQVRDALGLAATAGALSIDTQLAAIAAEVAKLTAIKAKTDLLDAGGTTSLRSPVLAGGEVEIVAEDDYHESDGRELSWTIEDWTGPVLTGVDATFRAIRLGDWRGSGEEAELELDATISLSGGDLVVTVEIDAEDTADLYTIPPATGDSHQYQIVATPAGGPEVTLASGKMRIVKKITPPAA